MEVINCKNCKRLFNYLGGMRICPNCMKELDEKYQVVKQYIYDNPHASIHEVAEANEVTLQQLRQWVREERLEFAEGSLAGLSCEICGAMIRSGKMCNACKGRMANNLGNLYKTEQPEVKKKETNSSARMRFLDN